MIGNLILSRTKPAISKAGSSLKVLSLVANKTILVPKPPPAAKPAPVANKVLAVVAPKISLPPPPPATRPIVQAAQPIAPLPASAPMTSLAPVSAAMGVGSPDVANSPTAWLPPPAPAGTVTVGASDMIYPERYDDPPDLEHASTRPSVPRPSPSSSVAPSSSVPPWAFAVGGAALAAVVVGAVMLTRRRR